MRDEIPGLGDEMSMFGSVGAEPARADAYARLYRSGLWAVTARLGSFVFGFSIVVDCAVVLKAERRRWLRKRKRRSGAKVSRILATW